MKSLAVIVIAVLASSAGAARAGEDSAPGGLTQFLQAQNISGTARTNYFRSSKRLDDDTDFLGATVQLKVLPNVTDTLDAKFEVRATHPVIGEGGGTTIRVLEGYATAHFAAVDVRIGKQIVAWGRADGINPTDNLTPRDYTVLLPFDDDQRFGTVAVKLDAYLSPTHTLTVFTAPFFEPSDIPRSADGGTVIEKMPLRTFSYSGIGIKLDKIGEGFDWSVSYFHGFSVLPEMRLLGSNALGPVLELHYDRIDVLGADFARNFGRFGLRGEVAYVNTDDETGNDAGIKNPYWFGVIGIDRTFFENLNINLQFFQRRIRSYHNPEEIVDIGERRIAMQNAILDGQRDRINNGISFRISNKWFNDTLELEIFSVVNVTRHDNLIRPLLTYAFSDHWKGALGAELYRGAADTQFGGLKQNRGAFAEVRYGF